MIRLNNRWLDALLLVTIQLLPAYPTLGQPPGHAEMHDPTCLSSQLVSTDGSSQDSQINSQQEDGCKGIALLQPGKESEVGIDRRAGFDSALESAFPMTPAMIHEYRDAYQANENAILSNPEPAPVIDTTLVWLEPGAEVPVINLSPGIATVVGFFDQAGTPWPVRQYVIGDGDNYEVIQLGDSSNTLAVAPKGRVGWSNLVVALIEESSPVVIRMNIGHHAVHYRTVVQVMKHGPNTATDHPITSPSLSTGDARLLSALIGYDLPEHAIRVQITGIEADAWLLDDELLLRTRYPLLSPAWSAHLAAPNGIKAYRLKIHSHILLATGDRITRARVGLE